MDHKLYNLCILAMTSCYSNNIWLS